MCVCIYMRVCLYTVFVSSNVCLSAVHQVGQGAIHLLHQRTAVVAAVMMMTHHLLAVAQQPPVAPLVRMKDITGRYVTNVI